MPHPTGNGHSQTTNVALGDEEATVLIGLAPKPNTRSGKNPEFSLHLADAPRHWETTR